MPLPQRDYVQQVFAKRNRASRVHTAVQRAWATVGESYPERGRWIRKATFRALMWEAAIRELELISRDDSGFRPLFHRDTASFLLDNSVLFRFKHADVALSTSNYPTSEALAFDDPDVDLWGYEGIQRVELCYVLDELETSVVWVGVAARAYGRFLWKLGLNSDGVEAGSEPSFFEDDVDISTIARLKPVEQIGEIRKKDKS